MQTLSPRRLRLALEHLEDRSTPAVHEWTGLGADNLWSSSQNWTNGAPSSDVSGNVDLVFHTNLTNSAQLVTQNDLVGQIVDSITFDASLGVIGPTTFAAGGTSNAGYTINGNTITINTIGAGEDPFGIDIANGVTATVGAGITETFNAGVALLNTNATFRSQNFLARLNFTGAINLGARTLTIDNTTGGGVNPAIQGVTISGDVSNGNLTKVASGTLDLSGDNSYADTTVNNGAVLVRSNTALGAAAGTITVNDPGLIKLRDGVTVVKTTFNNNSNVSGGGLGADGNTTNTFRGNVVLLAGNGGVALGAGVGAANASTRLIIDGVISGVTSTLFINGSGTIQFAKNNTYAGITDINGNQGFTTLQIDAPAGLGVGGAGANRMIIENGGAGGTAGGTVLLNFNGTLQDGGGIAEKIDFAGSGVGTLGALRSLGNSNVIIPGGVTFSAAAPWFIGVDGAAGSMTLTGVIDSLGANRALTKVGAGTLIIGGAAPNVFQGGVVVDDGTLRAQNTSATPLGTLAGPSGGLVTVNNSSTLRVDTGVVVPNSIQLNAGTTLSGTGTIAGVTSTGSQITPGASTGVLNGTTNVTLNNTSTFRIEINGAAPGSGYDQLKVAGTVSLNDTILSVDPSIFVPVVNNKFVVIDATSIVGTFAGLPEGSDVVFNGTTFTISYLGGDVTLTAKAIVTGNVRASVSLGTLNIVGDAAANGITVLPTATPGSFLISGLGQTTINSLPSVTLSNITSINVNLGDGADLLFLGGGTPFIIPGTLRVGLGRGDNAMQLKNVTVKRPTSVSGGINKDTMAVVDSTFEAAFGLSSSSGIDNVSIAKSVFKGNFAVNMAKNNNSLTIQNVSVLGNANINVGTYANSLVPPPINDFVNIQGSTFHRSFRLNTLGDNDDVRVEHCTFVGQSSFNLGGGNDQFRLIGSVMTGGFSLLVGQGNDTASVLNNVFQQTSLFDGGTGANTKTFTNNQFLGVSTVKNFV